MVTNCTSLAIEYLEEGFRYFGRASILRSVYVLKSHGSSHRPIRHHRTNPTPPDNGSSESRMKPTSPDHSDRLLPSHNPSVVGSIPTGPTKNNSLRYSLLVTKLRRRKRDQRKE